MIQVTLPDGKTLACSPRITGLEVATQISPSLAKNSIAMELNSALVDLNTPIEQDSHLRIITLKDPEALEIIRHDAAHILAQAIKELFPDAQITIGPVIKDGFYYDISPKEPLSVDDLQKIEKQMHSIVQRNIPITREAWDRNEAIAFFKKNNENFKAEIIQDLPVNEPISLYRQGDFIDLCRGPHAPSTKFTKHFKLMKLAGAYWRGDSKNVMLQRIYGTAWLEEADLKNHLHALEEAEKRDHRKLGEQLGLYHIQEEAPGMVFWHPNGWTLYRILETYIREKLARHNYVEVKTPFLLDKSLWERSGHLEKFGENMFMVHDEDKTMAIKPMSCPCHIEIFKIGTTSYKSLPIRMAEFGNCTRNEPSGSLHGLFRVRGFTQDDGHIFCSHNQIKQEAVDFISLLMEVYKELGFTKVTIRFSDRPEKRAGTDETWDKAEQALKEAIDETGLEYSLNKGEGAFYGPKLEFVLTDAIGRAWQCGTLQLDFVLAERLGAYYIDAEGHKQPPVLLHRAILGTFERFIGILIEHHGGHFPLWLAPVQIAITTITDQADDYAEKIKSELDRCNYRSILDKSGEKINYKIRKHSLQKIPVLVILGKEEQENTSVSIREFSSNNQTTFKNVDEFILYLNNKLTI